MQCVIKEIPVEEQNYNGEPKEILVESFGWYDNGEEGRTYTYKMSSDRYDRPIKKAYKICIEDQSFQNDQNKGKRETPTEILVATMNYYDFIDFNISDCIGDSKIQMVATKLGVNSEELWSIMFGQLESIKNKVRTEFEQTEEFKAIKEHKEIIQKYKESKQEFGRMYGIDIKNYDRCYDVFGHLKDQEYLNKVISNSEARKDYDYDSKNFRKKTYRYFQDKIYNQGIYNEEDRAVLEKFYKVLAKKFHPDANPDVDTSEEMKLINKLKKDWGI